MISNSAKFDSRTKRHTQSGVSVSDGSRDMVRTKSWRKKKGRKKKNERGQNLIASPTGIANEGLLDSYLLPRVNEGSPPHLEGIDLGLGFTRMAVKAVKLISRWARSKNVHFGCTPPATLVCWYHIVPWSMGMMFSIVVICTTCQVIKTTAFCKQR